MSIFGIGVPKFVGTGTPDLNTVILDYSTLDPKWSDARLIEHQSAISGKINYIALGYYASFVVTVQLHKYTSPTPSAKFTTLMSYLNQLVYFYPHKDGSSDGDGLGKPMKNSSGTQIKYFIKRISPYYIDNLVLQDLLEIEFVPENYIDLTKNQQ